MLAQIGSAFSGGIILIAIVVIALVVFIGIAVVLSRYTKVGPNEVLIVSGRKHRYVDADGTQRGFEINLTRIIAENVGIPVVASGGGGTVKHLIDVFKDARADAAIIASMIHTGRFTIKQIKDELTAAGIAIRQKW